MGSAMRKMGVYLGLLEDTQRYDDDYDDFDETSARRDEPRPVANIAERRRTQPGPVSVVTNRRPGFGLDRFRMLIVGTWNEGSVTNVATPAARSRAAESCGKASPSVVPAAAARNSRRVRFTRSNPTDQPLG